MDCNGEEYLSHTACTLWTPTSARRPSVAERTESAGPHPQGHRAEGSQDYLEGYLPIPVFEPSILEACDQEEDGPHCPSKEGYQDYYPAEANENTGASPYCLRCGDGDLEDQEKDIDQIVAEIKMSLSMMSITSANEASPEHGPEPGPGDSAEACLPCQQGPSRHEARAKSLSTSLPRPSTAEIPREASIPTPGPQRRGRSGPTSRMGQQNKRLERKRKKR
nr:amyloid beta A4 precursor protein-binding family A member 2-like isoform X2 [Aotus nancymaae]